jgi:hypothetical protein
MDKYDIRAEELEEKLRPQLTDEFLDTLVQAARTCGWSSDHTETMSFVYWCYDIVGKSRTREFPNLDPFQ